MMDPDSEEYRAFFLELAKRYNEEIQLENLHRDNLFRHIIACMCWIVFTIMAAWGIDLFPPWLVTGYGIMLLAILGVTLYNIHRKHKRDVAQSLKLREMALNFKDGIN